MSPATLVRQDEEVFEVHPRLREEGRVVVEEERKADDTRAARPGVLSDQRFAVPAVAEQVITELLLGPEDCVLQLLVAGELSDEREEGGHVGRDAGPDHDRPPAAPL